jgi:hypothetical protein
MEGTMPQENTGSAASGFLGMFNAFVDPAGLAKAATTKLFWLWPLITVTLIYVVFGYLMMPFTLQLMDTMMTQRMTAQNVPADRIETARNMAHMFSSVGLVVTPIMIIAMLALAAWLVTVVGSIVGLRAKFRDVFSLVAACSLITSLQYVATFIVLKVKGDEITSPEQMTPPFGIDIFVQDVHGVMLALLNFFSIFTIWHFIILGFALAYMTKSSKGKAFVAITPAWLIPLLFRLVGAMFSGGNASS